jgi:hypothetical protein
MKLLRSPSGPTHLSSPTLLQASPPAELIRSARESIQDGTPQVVDLLQIAPLLRAEAHDLPRTQPTLVEQLGQSLFAPGGQHDLEGFPHLAAFCLLFRQWLACLTRRRPGDLLLPRVGA